MTSPFPFGAAGRARENPTAHVRACLLLCMAMLPCAALGQPRRSGTHEPLPVRERVAAGPAAAATSAPAGDTDRALARALAVWRAYLAKLGEARDLSAGAHARLDEGAYDEAVATHRKARAAKAQAAALKRQYDRMIGEVVARYLAALDSDSYKTRRWATAELARLGPHVTEALENALKDASPEAKARLTMILAGSKKLMIDEHGYLHQWASDARASSEFGNPAWSARQATGKPDTNAAGDHPTAWASKEQDAGQEWLELTYDQPVRLVRLRIRETFNPGAVTGVEAKDDRGQWRTIWQGKDPTAAAPGWLEVAPRERATWRCRAIRIRLDSAAVAGWNEIDAVELIGEPTAGIAKSAPATKPRARSQPQPRR